MAGAAGEQSDVLIVGYGPVGQLLALLLVQNGWRVTVVERWPEPYPMPRAVAFDGEGARTLSAVGVGGLIGEIGEPSGEYLWKNAEGQVLLHIDGAADLWCGWPESTSMYQPALEAALQARGTEFAELTVLRGMRAVRLAEHQDFVELTAVDAAGAEHLLTARWVVGCDGANSFVREHVPGTVTDLGFSHDWLICDVVLDEEREFKPNNLQICDPARPRTEVSAGPGHRRWEFMRVGDETVAGLNTPETAWRLLGLFGVDQQNARLERHHVYTFQASLADQWRSGRLLLAGDAAHVMPPFAGQGMSSGFRDAKALAWRLDAVLRGTAQEGLLDSYTEERRTHVKHALTMSVNLGKIICQTDAVAAAERDQVMRATAERAKATGTVSRRSPLQPLSRGLLHVGANQRPVRPAGALTPQARVARAGRSGLFDDVVGTGFVLLTTEDPHALLDAAELAFLERLGTHLVQLRPAGGMPAPAAPHLVEDLDGTLLGYLADAGATALLVRPDYYVYGAAADRQGLAELLATLRERLGAAAAMAL
ncbi:bifunctional 3-(3-hydroxy-phenyl)propionate/3-hydroxycinnamic acid hydroxylase MhpA [Kitasatospora mediocidica]|uniref:bifunctional 3-(3-hydroxy-phenyl)propionate/3-hydroxycinnamic acid hydroxylase MhpA n=1 Tax=Kitasatospora mediocidica TaxID=58352 RepID=UPI00055C09CE|nr:bifunctional 3-(3-hydroxy-phenyl)propionate/3-hydroxycinnamic acid hydroxylase [Kitasatospora mediocidica]